MTKLDLTARFCLALSSVPVTFRVHKGNDDKYHIYCPQMDETVKLPIKEALSIIKTFRGVTDGILGADDVYEANLDCLVKAINECK